MEQELLKKPLQFPPNELADENERIYRGWGSVEIRDSHGDLLPMAQFKKIMPIIMDRGGIILDSHSNRQTGKIINFEFKTNEESGKEGILLTVKNFKGTKFDEMVWTKIKSGDYTGFSFGGMAIGNPEISFDKTDVTKIINEFEGFEFSNVETPANKSSTYTEINYLAKEDSKLKKEKNEDKLLKKVKEVFNLKTKSEEILEKVNKLKEIKLQKECENFKYQKGYNKSMAEEIQPNQEESEVNSVEDRLNKLEEAVTKILEMVSSEVQMQKEKELEKEEDVSEETNLPKAPAEEIQDDAPASGAESDKETIMEKELKEIKKSLNELSEIKKMLQANKSTTPRIENSDIKKSEENVEVNSFKDAHKIARRMGVRR